MEKYICTEQNGLCYELVGAYYLPCLAPDQPEQRIGIWGQRKHRFLREQKRVLYNCLLLSGDLLPYLIEIDQQAQKMYDRLINQAVSRMGITEQLKENNQTAWVQMMNAIKGQVQEIVNTELIYN